LSNASIGISVFFCHPGENNCRLNSLYLDAVANAVKQEATFSDIYLRGNKMTQTNPSAVSLYFASSLLAAWDSGDLATLNNALGQTASADKTRLPGCERERIEVVQGIAETIDAWQREIRWVGQVDLEVSLGLLGNVARPRALLQKQPYCLPHPVECSSLDRKLGGG
jgi:hypothetical protein